MSRRPRRRFTEAQKAKAVLDHVQDGVPVSQVCEELGIHPNQYYDWQKQAFCGLPQVFSREISRQERSHQRQVESLKEKLSQKDEVIAELLSEHIALKKKIGANH
ncbi:MAG: hypothetical protein MAG581_00112 [Deltaproteobacteria bacterium]|jgi:transposase-like protein|nr:hypothetical protein [Deltaproteobacteria bacterium]